MERRIFIVGNMAGCWLLVQMVAFAALKLKFIYLGRFLYTNRSPLCLFDSRKTPGEPGTVRIHFSVQPDEMYSLAGQISVSLSFEHPMETQDNFYLGTLNLLERSRSGQTNRALQCQLQ